MFVGGGLALLPFQLRAFVSDVASADDIASLACIVLVGHCSIGKFEASDYLLVTVLLCFSG